MKRCLILVLCLSLALVFVGCGSNNSDEVLQSGTYYMTGEFEKGLTPYVSLSFEDMSVSIGGGTYMSFAAVGSFEIDGRSLVATTQVATFVFDIKDNNTLIVVDGGDSEFLHIREKSEFVHFDSIQ